MSTCTQVLIEISQCQWEFFTRSFSSTLEPGRVFQILPLLRSSRLLQKPFSNPRAKSLALAGLTAWRGLFTKAGLKPTEKLLVTVCETAARIELAQLIESLSSRPGKNVWI